MSGLKDGFVRNVRPQKNDEITTTFFEEYFGVYTGYSDGKDEERKQFILEEKKALKIVEKAYLEKVEQTEKSRKDFLDRLIENASFDYINLDIDKIKKNFKSTNEINDLANINYYLKKIAQTIDDLHIKNIDISNIEEEYYELEGKIQDNINNNIYIQESYIELKSFSDNFIKQSKKLIQESDLESLKFIENDLFNLESEINTPLIYTYYNDIKSFASEINMKEKTFDYNEKYFDIVKETFSISELFSKMEFIDDFDNINTLVKSINDVIDLELNIETKYNMIKERYKVLTNEYKKQSRIHKDFLELKSEFDYNYKKSIYYSKYLDLNVEEYKFDSNTTKHDVENLKKQVKVLEDKYVIIKNNNESRKIIREAMKKLQYKYIYTDKENNKINTIKDIYHIENGNVVSVVSSDLGNIIYEVNGVKIDGIAESKESVVETMRKFCIDKKIIEKEFQEKGYTYFESVSLLPNINLAREITLPNSVSLSNKNFIRTSKLKQNQQNKQQKKSRAI